MNILQKAWQRWKIIGGVVGNYQSRAVILFFYYTIMLPFGLGVRLFSDPLRIRAGVGAAAWVTRAPVSAHPDDARRQF